MGNVYGSNKGLWHNVSYGYFDCTENGIISLLMDYCAYRERSQKWLMMVTMVTLPTVKGKYLFMDAKSSMKDG